MFKIKKSTIQKKMLSRGQDLRVLRVNKRDPNRKIIHKGKIK